MAKLRTFIQNGNWYKGNLHLHTTISDGHLDPVDSVAVYRDNGYDFLAVTDHSWYGIHNDLQTDNFLIFGGTELGELLECDKGFCHHIVVIGHPDETKFTHGQNVQELCKGMTTQQMIDFVKANGNVAIYCHPRWSHVSMKEYLTINGCIGMEVYNHVSEIACSDGDAISYFEHSLWTGNKIFAFATDDAHARSGYMGGWINVKAKSLTHKDIMDAIKVGSFYASSGGPEIYDFYVDGGIAYIKCAPSARVGFFGDATPGNSFNAEGALITEQSWEFSKVWSPGGRMNCVYAVCFDEYGRKSWTQPVWL